MATFSILTNFDNPSWATGDNFGKIQKSGLTYTRYGDQTLVYCNNPETITSDYLGEEGYFINKATITTSEALLYISCNSGCSTSKKLAVRVYNPNSNGITITKVNSGFNYSYDWSPQIGTYEEFFTDINIPHPIGAGQSEWVDVETVGGNARFEALMKYSITGGPVVMAIYFCTNTSSITTDPVAPPISQNEYSGTADAFYITGNNTIESQNLFNGNNHNSVFYGIAQKKFSGNTTEHNPITLVQNGIVASEDHSTYNNLGNYGLQYAFNTTLKNTSSSRVKFKGYVISNKLSHCAGISSGGLARAVFLGPAGEGIGKNYIRWNFCETNYINAGSQTTLNYQYMHLGRGNAPGIIQWEAIREN